MVRLWSSDEFWIEEVSLPRQAFRLGNSDPEPWRATNEQLRALAPHLGKRVRVTVEVIDE
jgi:hypothetical protein